MNDTDVRASSPRYTAYVVGVLVTVYMVHHIDRQIVTLLLEPIRKEFLLSDTQLGLLAGLAYAIPFALAGIPLGLLIDRTHRVRLLAGLITVWSALTALCAFTGSFWALVLARIGVAAAESGATPSNVSIISDYVPEQKRASALGIYYMGPQLATMVGFAVAGVVAAAWGWRAAFLVAGLPGLLLALLVWRTIREPPRTASLPGPSVSTANAGPTFRQLVAAFRMRPAALHLVIGSTLINVVAAALSTWLPALMIRGHGLDVKQVGLAIAFGIAPLGALGSLVAGRVADRLAVRDPVNVPRMLAISTLVTIPSAAYGIYAGQVELLVAAFALQSFAHLSTVAPAYAGTLALMPGDMRGSTAATMQVASNVLGYGVGTQLVGLLSDWFGGGGAVASLRPAMLIVALLNVWPLFHFLRAAQAMRARSQ